MTIEELVRNFYKEIDDIDQLFMNEINQWTKPAKLIVLAEAPVSNNRYFYKSLGSFLNLVLKHYQSINQYHKPIINFLRNKGILILDIYKFPIPSEFYVHDKNNFLYENDFILTKIDLLKRRQLIDSNTYFVFRYNRLITKKLFFKPALSKLNYAMINKDHIPLGISRNAAKLNPDVITFLP